MMSRSVLVLLCCIVLSSTMAFQKSVPMLKTKACAPAFTIRNNKPSSLKMALPTRTLFNLLERGRSNMLGGPEVLAQSAQSAVHYYVARVTDYQLSFIDTSILTNSKSHNPWVRVSTTVTPVGSQMLDFDQQVSLALDNTAADAAPCPGSSGYCYTVVPNSGGDCKLFADVLLARCCVTVACVDALSGVPAILPSEIKMLLS